MRYLCLKQSLLLLFIILTTTISRSQESVKFAISGKIIDKEGRPQEGALVIAQIIDTPEKFKIKEKDFKEISFWSGIDGYQLDKGTIKNKKKRKQDYIKSVIADNNGFFHIESDEILSHFYVRSLGMVSLSDILAKNDSVYTIVMEEEQMDLEPIKVAKPVIYLYPQQETEIQLLVNFHGNITFTYPAYNKGWNVMAKPDGSLLDRTDNSLYNYLFWEGDTYSSIDVEELKEGYLVEGENATDFLKSILPKLGLLPNEYNEFIVYWGPLLAQNKWNLVHFVTGDDYNMISTNTVKPIPDTNIRIFMYYKVLNNKIIIAPQKIKTPNRDGFTLVEWGGAKI